MAAQQRKIDVLESQMKAQASLISSLETRVGRLERPRKGEIYYQSLLEQITGGQHMHLKGVGTTDVTTDDAHIEIKTWLRYHEVPGQLQKYQLACPRTKSVVYFFGTRPSATRLQAIVQCMVASGIEMYSFDEDDVVVTHNVFESETESNPFGTWCESRLTKSLGNQVHIHQVVKFYNDTIEDPRMRVDGHKGAKMLKAAGFTVGKKTRLKTCEPSCVEKRNNLPYIQNVTINVQQS